MKQFRCCIREPKECNLNGLIWLRPLNQQQHSLHQLASLLYDRARQVRLPAKPDAEKDTPEVVARYEERKALQTQFLTTAVTELHRTLEVDSENATAHYLLRQIYDELGETDLAEKHKQLHDRYADLGRHQLQGRRQALIDEQR